MFKCCASVVIVTGVPLSYYRGTVWQVRVQPIIEEIHREQREVG